MCAISLVRRAPSDLPLKQMSRSRSRRGDPMVSRRDRRCRSGTSPARDHCRCSVQDKQELSASVDIHGVRGIDKPLSISRGPSRPRRIRRACIASGNSASRAPHRIRDRSIASNRISCTARYRKLSGNPAALFCAAHPGGSIQLSRARWQISRDVQ
jgi:hypothetical protein